MKDVIETIIAAMIVVISVITLIFVISFLVAIFIKLLWNWIMADIFALPIITYWQAWGLYLLSNLLFKATITKNNK